MSRTITPSPQSITGENLSINARGPSQLRPGEVLSDLKVVEKAIQEGGTTRISKGVVVDGKFIPVVLPSDVKSGEHVDLKVEFVNDQIQLRFLQRTPEQSAKPQDPSKQLLESLLKTLNLNHETSETLRTVFIPLLSKSDESAKPLVIPEVLKKLLRSSQVPELKDLKTAEKLKVMFSRDKEMQVGEHLSTISKLRAASSAAQPNSRALEIVRLILRELNILKLDLTVKTKGGETLPKLPDGQAKDVSGVLRNLAPRFESVSQTEDAGHLLPIFKDLIAAQVDTVKTFEARVKLLLSDNNPGGTFSQLMAVLEQLKKETENDTSPIGRLLYNFAQTLSSEIEKALKLPNSAEAIKLVLEEGLKNLYETFKLTPLLMRFNSEADESLFIPPQLKGSLRLIEVQLILVLGDANLEEQLAELHLDRGKGLLLKLQQLHLEIEKVIQQNPAESRPPQLEETFERLEEARRVIAQLLNPEETATRPPTSTQLKALLENTRLALVQSLQTEVGESFISVLSSAERPQLVQRIVKNIERVMIEMLKSESLPHSEIPLKEIIKNPELLPHHALKTLLKQLVIELPASGSAADDALLESTFQLLDQIEKSERENLLRAAPLKESAQRALQQFQRYLSASEPADIAEQPFNQIDSETLKRVGSLVASQEALQRMMPMMKVLGEPALMLFPFIVGNLMHKAQISFYTPTEMDIESKRGSSRGEAQQLFSRIKLLIPLPGMGRVLVDAAYRPGEMLLNLGFEQESVAAFIETKSIELRRILTSIGYTKTQISIVTLDPNWNNAEIVQDSPLQALLNSSSLFSG